MPGRNGLDVADDHYLTAEQFANVSRVGRNTVYQASLCTRFGPNSAGIIQHWIVSRSCASARVHAAYGASQHHLAASRVGQSAEGEGITQPKVCPNLDFIAGQWPCCQTSFEEVSQMEITVTIRNDDDRDPVIARMTLTLTVPEGVGASE